MSESSSLLCPSSVLLPSHLTQHLHWQKGRWKKAMGLSPACLCQLGWRKLQLPWEARMTRPFCHWGFRGLTGGSIASQTPWNQSWVSPAFEGSRPDQKGKGFKWKWQVAVTALGPWLSSCLICPLIFPVHLFSHLGIYRVGPWSLWLGVSIVHQLAPWTHQEMMKNTPSVSLVPGTALFRLWAEAHTREVTNGRGSWALSHAVVLS